MNLVIPKTGAKHELLLNKPTYDWRDGICSHLKLELRMSSCSTNRSQFVEQKLSLSCSFRSEQIYNIAMNFVTLCCAAYVRLRCSTNPPQLIFFLEKVTRCLHMWFKCFLTGVEFQLIVALNQSD